MQRLYVVYKLQCLSNSKVYIGITCQKPEHRWRKGKAYSGELREDIDRYGWDNFTKEILKDNLLVEDAAKAEKEYIALYATQFAVYNSTIGGESKSDAELNALSEKMTGRKISADVRKNMSEARKGIIFSDEHKKNLSVSHIGNAGYWTGKKRDEITVRAVSKKLSLPIRCVETGETFANLKDASKKTGYPMSCISKWVNGVKPKKCPYTFERVV